MWKSILSATFIAGALDIIAAFINSYLSSGVKPASVLKFIASGVFGKDAFSGGFEMLIFGLFFHFLISFFCVLVFYLFYPRMQFLKKSKWTNAVIIGIAAWLVTNLVIVPLSKAPDIPLEWWSSLKALLILIICIGLPTSFIAWNYFNKKAVPIK